MRGCLLLLVGSLTACHRAGRSQDPIPLDPGLLCKPRAAAPADGFQADSEKVTLAVRAGAASIRRACSAEYQRAIGHEPGRFSTRLTVAPTGKVVEVCLDEPPEAADVEFATCV